jgi:hypothetical protein
MEVLMSGSRKRLHHWRGTVVSLLLTVALGSTVRAQQAHSEAEVKAAYLYRFAAYVEWPKAAETGRPFVIAVMGQPSIARELKKLQPGHLINDQVVQVIEVTQVQQLANAQILYVGADHDDFLRSLNRIETPPILIVTDENQGLDLGGILNFVTIDHRVRFEVSLTAAERAQLKVSADLLSVAVRVNGGRRQSDAVCLPFSLPQEDDALCGTRRASLLQTPSRADQWGPPMPLTASLADMHATD